MHALLSRHREEERRADYRAGVLASLVSSFGKGQPPKFFFPSLDPKGRRKTERMSDEALYQKLLSLKTMFAKG